MEFYVFFYLAGLMDDSVLDFNTELQKHICSEKSSHSKRGREHTVWVNQNI